MSVLTGSIFDHSKFDTMSTEALTALLHQDSLTLDLREVNIQAILYITGLIEKREKESPSYPVDPVDTAWERFCRRSFGPETGAEESPCQPEATQEVPRVFKPTKSIRILLIAAAVTLLFISMALAAAKLGWIPFWTKEHFTFVQPEDNSIPVNTQQYPALDETFNSLEEALAAYGAPDNLVPNCLLREYKQTEFKCIFEPGVFTMFSCTFSKGTIEIYWDATLYHRTDGNQGDIYKDNPSPDVYTVNNIEHYIMANNNMFKAVWQHENYECMLSGFKTREELVGTIDSIYTKKEKS